jgi:hypothetical protein
MLGLKGELNDVLVKRGWTQKSNKGYIMKYEQDERQIEIKLSFKKK